MTRKIVWCGLLVLVCTLAIGATEYTYNLQTEGSLQEYFNKLQDGDTLYIEQGIYVIDSGLTLYGVNEVSIIGKGEVWIICNDIYSDVLSMSDCGMVALEALKMRHQEPAAEYACTGGVLYAYQTEYLSVFSCELNGCGAVGVWADNCGTVDVSSCYIHDNSWTAISISTINRFSLTYSTVVDNHSFLQAYNVLEMEMYDNTIAYNSPYTTDYADEYGDEGGY